MKKTLIYIVFIVLLMGLAGTTSAVVSGCQTSSNVFRDSSYWQYDSCLNIGEVKHWVYKDDTTRTFRDNLGLDVIQISGGQKNKTVTCLNGHELIQPANLGKCERGSVVFTRLSSTSAKYSCTSYENNNDSTWNYICQKTIQPVPPIPPAPTPIPTPTPIPAPVPYLLVSCAVYPNSIQAGQSATFTSNASGGTGTYNYVWSGVCFGISQTCSNTFYTQGIQTASVTVTSGLQTNTAVCTINVDRNCTSNYQQRCVNSNLYWYDSCGNQQGPSQYCQNGCSGNTCINNINTCTSHSYQRCSGNNLSWYDSCGSQQDVASYCPNGCSGNSCQNYNNNNNNNYNNYSNYGNCTYHAYKLCVGNSAYWYDSCGTRQDPYTNCGGNQTCQYGQCAAGYIVNPVLPPVQPINTYNPYYRKACSGSSLYWYDSLGAISGLYKNCNDNDSCTTDTCSANTCVQTQIANCQTNNPVQNNCGNGLCEPNLGETTTNCSSDCKISAPSALSTSLFAKQDANSNQWQKTAQVNSDSQIYFMVSATNSSTTQIENVNISANIPTEISSLGNLQINGVPVAGDIVAGVNIGSVAPSTTKLVTFEGKTQTISAAITKQATATSDVAGIKQSDSVSINLNPGQVAGASVSSSDTTSGFWGFLKRWYLWILGALVLVFLFVIVFKRLSSEN